MNVGQLKDFLDAYETNLRLDAQVVVELDLPDGRSVPCEVVGLSMAGEHLLLEITQPGA
jgi:hypothetical protein